MWVSVRMRQSSEADFIRAIIRGVLVTHEGPWVELSIPAIFRVEMAKDV